MRCGALKKEKRRTAQCTLALPIFAALACCVRVQQAPPECDGSSLVVFEFGQFFLAIYQKSPLQGFILNKDVNCTNIFYEGKGMQNEIYHKRNY